MNYPTYSTQVKQEDTYVAENSHQPEAVILPTPTIVYDHVVPKQE